MGKNRHFPKVNDLIRVLISLNEDGTLTTKSLGLALELSPATVSRIIQRLRVDYLVKIERPQGGKGVYKIKNWGLFDKAAAYNYLMKGAVPLRARRKSI